MIKINGNGNLTPVVDDNRESGRLDYSRPSLTLYSVSEIILGTWDNSLGHFSKSQSD